MNIGMVATRQARSVKDVITCPASATWNSVIQASSGSAAACTAMSLVYSAMMGTRARNTSAPITAATARPICTPCQPMRRAVALSRAPTL